jgi:hypothetical protein
MRIGSSLLRSTPKKREIMMIKKILLIKGRVIKLSSPRLRMRARGERQLKKLKSCRRMT